MRESLYSHVAGLGIENEFTSFVSADIGSKDVQPEFGKELLREFDILRTDPGGRRRLRVPQQIGTAKKFYFKGRGNPALS